MNLKGYLFVEREGDIFPIDISGTSNFDYKDYDDVGKTMNEIKDITGYLVMLTDRK